MQAVSIRIFLILTILILLSPSSLLAAPEQRIALVIGNSSYSSGPLKNPVNDATDMAAMLKKLGFTVTLKRNASLQEMDVAIEAFGNRLKRGGVGLFYYAGHGVQVNGVNYLLPVGAKINKEADVKYQAVDANKILDEMATANNGLNIVMLDACRDNPFARSFRNAARGLAIVSSAPSGTFISYSTSPGNVARDGDGRNSPYTAALLKYIQAPGLTISDVFINVRTKVKKETGQVPWELSSLEGQFYFMPGSAKMVTDRVESSVSVPSPTDELDDENRKLEAEQRRLEEERASFAKKKVLEEKRQKIADERERLAAEQEEARQAALVRKQAKKPTTLAMAKRPSVSTAGETGRDGRFIAYDNGTVLDTKTNLMWAAKDHGSNINWQGAKNYCENYRGGGYTDWRMPTHDELAGLYDESKTYKTPFGDNAHLTELIRLTSNWVWASETRGSDATKFNFFFYFFGARNTYPQSSDFGQALPVRSVASGPKETRRDDRFIAYDDGTVLDTKTNLMWAAKDNGSDINWANAKSYCDNYRGGGHSDWRMPTQDELVGLYDAGKSRWGACNTSNQIHVATELIDITCFCPWASETRGSEAAYFNFNFGLRRWGPQSYSNISRALPVRSGK
jgi:hypothetical protein